MFWTKIPGYSHTCRQHDAYRQIIHARVRMLKLKSSCDEWVHLAPVIDSATQLAVRSLAVVHATNNRKDICSPCNSAVRPLRSHSGSCIKFPQVSNGTPQHIHSFSQQRYDALLRIPHTFSLHFPWRLGPQSWLQTATYPLTLNISIFTHMYAASRNKTTCLYSTRFLFLYRVPNHSVLQ